MKRVWIFDLDGTLLDTMPQYQRLAAGLMAQHYSVDIGWAAEAYRKTTGKPFIHQLMELFPDQTERHGRVYQEFLREKKEGLDLAQPFPEANAILSTLIKGGDAVVISSGTEEALLQQCLRQKRLPHSQAFGYREGFLKGADHFQVIKDIYAPAASNDQTDGISMIFVGDSLNDGMVARANQIPFIARIGMFSEAEFKQWDAQTPCIHSLKELLDGSIRIQGLAEDFHSVF